MGKGRIGKLDKLSVSCSEKQAGYRNLLNHDTLFRRKRNAFYILKAQSFA